MKKYNGQEWAFFRNRLGFRMPLLPKPLQAELPGRATLLPAV